MQRPEGPDTLIGAPVDNPGNDAPPSAPEKLQQKPAEAEKPSITQNPPAQTPASPEKTETKPAETAPSQPAASQAEKPAEKPEEKKPEIPGQRSPVSPAVGILTPPADARVQMNFFVPQITKDRFQAEANVAFEYGWIPSNSMTQFLVWLADKYMFEVMKTAALKRRQAKEA